MKKSKYKLSVRLMTFNHSSFIDQAIEGVLRQETNFLFELVIGDDFSTDNTRELISNYRNTKNVHIKILDRPVGGEYYFNRKKNGRLHNFVNIIANCSGEYIALLDGDDYWTDPLKLQKQVDILDSKPNFSACFTNALIIDENNENFKEKFKNHSGNKTFSIKDVVKRGGGFFPTASLLFRNSLGNFPSFFLDARSGDRALALLLSNLGEIHFLNEITCVYRKHGGGIYTAIENDNFKRLEIDLNNMDLLKNFNEFTNHKHEEIIRKMLSNYSQRVLTKYFKELTNPIKSQLKNNLLFIDKIRFLKNSAMNIIEKS